MDRNLWWSFITLPLLEPQTVILKPKIISSLSFNVIKPITSNSHCLTHQRLSEGLQGNLEEKKKKNCIHQMSNKGPSTNHGHLPHHFCFNLCIFSFRFCLVFETSRWVFVLLLILVFLQILGLVTSLRRALEMRWFLIFVCKLGSLEWRCLDFSAKVSFS